MEVFQWARDRLEAPLFGDVPIMRPLVLLLLLVLLDYAWRRNLFYME